MTTRRALRAPLISALLLALIVGGCSEDLETGAVCPALCPGQELEILDTILDPAVVIDTALQPYPGLGFEPLLLLAARGDTLDVRGVVRWDTIIRSYRDPDDDSIRAVTRVDSATIQIRLARTGIPLPATFFIDVYDVDDSTVADTIPTTLLPHFTPARLLGTVQVDTAGLKDTTTIKIPIDTAKLLDIIEDANRNFRVGFQVRAAQSVEVSICTADGCGIGPRLRYRVHPDTSVSVAIIDPSSSTPATPLFTAQFYEEYSIIADAPDPLAAQRLAVGGLPSARTYLRFDLPLWLTDSSAVVRARLVFTQDPVYGPDEDDSITVKAQMVLAGQAITDLRRAALLLAPVDFLIRDSLRIAPGDSGTRSLELNAVVRQWRSIDGQRPIPSAIVLKSTKEGFSMSGVRFFGTAAGATLRPKLHVSYVPNITYGQP